MKTLSQHILFLSLVIIFGTMIPIRTLASNGGAVYSRYGIGILNYFPSSRSAGMGGAGFSTLPTNSIDEFNPAAWARINRTRFAVNGLYEGLFTSDGSSTAYFGSMGFNGFMIAIPISVSNGVVLGLGLAPYSRVRYDVVSNAIDANDLTYSMRYTGSGGLSQGQIGLSASITQDLNIGVRLNYIGGILNFETQQIFGPSEYAEVTRSRQLDGLNQTFGVVYTGLKQYLNLTEKQSFNVAAIFTTTTYLSSRDEKYYLYRTSTLRTRDTTLSEKTQVRLPYSLGVGVSYGTEKILAVTDFYYHNWENSFSTDGSLTELRNSYRISAGCEFLPRREMTAPFLSQIAYRLGTFYHSSYFQINNKPINEFGATAGFGIPLFIDTRLDFGFEYAIRGTTELQIQKDNIIRFTLSINGSELWFVRPEIE
jgi:hypothetical protein